MIRDSLLLTSDLEHQRELSAHSFIGRYLRMSGEVTGCQFLAEGTEFLESSGVLVNAEPLALLIKEP